MHSQHRSKQQIPYKGLSQTLLLVNLSVLGILALTAQSSQANNVIEEVSRSSPSSLVQVAQTSITQVTGIQVNPTDMGLEIRLETTGGQLDIPMTNVVGNALIADIPNAVLALPDAEDYQMFSPADGIAAISVMPRGDNQIRVSITGTTAPPVAEILSETQGLAFRVNPESPVATTPEAVQAEALEDSIQVVVTATRTEEELQDVPRSVTVIEREQIQEQANLNTNLQDILGTLVPGFGPPSQSTRILASSLRGRPFQLLIDGVPISTNQNTAFNFELRSISPSAIERIEVVRGPSAAFGEGATGGVINIITRRPTDDSFTATSEVRVNAALGRLQGDSIGNYLEQTFSGNAGIVDYFIGVSREQTGYFYDAEGDRIPFQQEGVEDAQTYDLFGSLGVDLTDTQRLQLSVNHFYDTQDIEFLTDPDVAEGEKARAIEIEDIEIIDSGEPRRTNTVVSLTYTNENLLGSEFQIQGYYRRNFGLNAPEEDTFSIFPEFNVSSGEQESERWGGRLQLETPIVDTLSLLWGADYSNENLSQTRNIFDEAEFIASDRQVFRKIDERFQTPPYTVENLGLFAQLQWEPSDRWFVSGGLRYENIGVDVEDYTTILGSVRRIEGGNLNADAVVFNLGATYNITDEVSVFASFAQGFGVPDFGRILRRPPQGFTAIESDLNFTDPQTVYSYELGLRGDWQNLQASLVGFYSDSELGVTTRIDEAGILQPVRAPQRNYGIEASLDWQPSDRWLLGGIFSWNEGEIADGENGEYLALDTFEVQPWKLTAYVENETTPGWRNRLQALFVGNRDRGFEDGVDGAPIEGFVVVDFLSSIELGPGVLTLGIQNLLDNQYFPITSQYLAPFDPSSNRAASGRTISLGYRVTW
jgi:iron complex outermembrane recepter protein